MDYAGIALVIVATGGFMSAVVGQVLAVLTYIRMGRATEAVTVLHDSVNGQTRELKAALAQAAYSAGEKAGTEAERANVVAPNSP